MSTIITGEENVRSAQAMTQLHFWRMQANMKINFDMTPRRGWTIQAFNAQYGVKAKTWQDIYDATNETLKDIRRQFEKDESSVAN